MKQTPNNVARYLEDKSQSGAGKGSVTPAGLAPAAPVAAQVAVARDERIYRSISRTYHIMRVGMALLAIAFPLLLWMWSSPGELQTSLSAYYHYDVPGGKAPGAGDSRNIFVGTLWAVGSFLILYRGYSLEENWALNVAGVSAILVSLLPMDWPHGDTRTLTGTLHYFSAALFFAMIAFVCLFLSGETLEQLDDPPQRRFSRLYALYGALMIVVPSAALVMHLTEVDRTESHAIWVIEVVGILVFAVFWITKTIEIRLLEKKAGLSS